MLDETIELLTKQMIEDNFKCKSKHQKVVINMTKTELYKFCIDLVKIVKRVKEME